MVSCSIICAVVQENLHNLFMTVTGSSHQWCLAIYLNRSLTVDRFRPSLGSLLIVVSACTAKEGQNTNIKLDQSGAEMTRGCSIILEITILDQMIVGNKVRHNSHAF